jgi:transcriptional regulator with XRE-family HTH domain
MVDKTPATALPAHVLERPDMRDAIARHDFGTVFALARKWAGISYSKIAEACGIKPERVGTLARGEGSITSYEKIARIADAMLIPGHMLGLSPRIWETVARGVAISTTAITSHSNGGGDVLRRDFIKSSAVGIVTALGLPTLDVGASGRRLGTELPAAIRQRAARLRRLDNVLGGGDTYRLYLAEFESTQTLLKHGTYSEAVGRDLLSVLAEQAQQAGWAAFDAGDHERAIRLYEASSKAAKDAGDAALAGNALAFLAYQRIGANPADAVQLATASCEVAEIALSGSVGALLHERRAWAHAVAGNAAETEHALDMARLALADSSGQSQPDWSIWVDESELQIMAGRCWAELRRPLRAVPILRDVLEKFDDTHARDKALYLSWLAHSYLIAGEVEESAAVADRVLDLSVGVASVRPRRQLAGVLMGLSEHRQIPAVAVVLDKARS